MSVEVMVMLLFQTHLRSVQSARVRERTFLVKIVMYAKALATSWNERYGLDALLIFSLRKKLLKIANKRAAIGFNLFLTLLSMRHVVIIAYFDDSARLEVPITKQTIRHG